MKPTSLERLIEGSRGPSDAVVVTSGGIWSLDDLRAAGSCHAVLEAIEARSIALSFHDPLKLLTALIMLDARADRLLLLAADLPGERVVELAHRSGMAAILTDRPDLARASSTILWPDAVGPCSARSTVGSGEAQRTGWVLATSGTTGTPKLVEHDFAALARSLRTGCDPGWRWGQMYDTARFAGLQVLLQAMAQGVLLLPRPECSLAQKLAFLASEGVSAISATPTLWRKILMTPEAGRLQLRQATLGGEIADGPILAAIAARFPGTRVTHVYASTEAGASFAVTDGRPGFPLAMLQRSGSGPALKIVGNRLFVRSEDGSRNYVASDTSYADADGFVDTGDIVEVGKDRCLFRGRASGVINVGGDKVYPQEIEEVLLSHPDVRLAQVRAKSSPIIGQMVTAEIVTHDEVADVRELAKLLRAHCAQHLPRWKCPATIRFVSEVLADHSGKIRRSA
jgi:acyl-CoA synthetase (AMP-forming)/AMP-acid ligase II